MTTPTTEVSTSEAVAPAASGRDRDSGARALGWWRRHVDPANGKVDPATRARLRRARSHLDVLRIEPAVALARQLGAAPKSRAAPAWRTYAALDLARVLAHVKEHESRHPMRAAGWKRFPYETTESEAGADRPLLSDARFKRLLETGEGEEKVLAFTRLVALLGGTVNVPQLANDFLVWNHPEHGDRVRERWAFEYLHAGSAAPDLPAIDSDTDAEDDA